MICKGHMICASMYITETHMEVVEVVFCNTVWYGYGHLASHFVCIRHVPRMSINEILQSDWCCNYSCSDIGMGDTFLKVSIYNTIPMCSEICWSKKMYVLYTSITLKYKKFHVHTSKKCLKITCDTYQNWPFWCEVVKWYHISGIDTCGIVSPIPSDTSATCDWHQINHRANARDVIFS